MRLIDANELAKRARPIENFPKGTMVVVLGVVNSLPTVEIVRCKECKYYCEYDASVCDKLWITTSPDDYCSRGERKTE